MDFSFLHHQAWGGVYPAVFATSLVVALVTTPLVRLYSRKIGFLDVPNQRTSHSTPIPLGGGAAIALAFVVGVHVGLFRAQFNETAIQIVVFGGLITLTIGLVDDFIGGIPAQIKLVALLALTLALWWFDDNLILKIFPWTWLNLLFTLLWIVGVASAINAIDNMNGLSVGFAAIASLTYFFVAMETMSDRVFPDTLNRFWGMVSLALCGGCLGFLPYNFPKGRIFIGDGGSFFLGFNLAVLGVMGQWSDQSAARATIPLLILALPLFDLTFVVYTRHQSGVTKTWLEAIRHCARDHLSHRLVSLGLSSTQAVLVLHAVAAILAIHAVVLRREDSQILTYMHLGQAGLILLILGVLIKVSSSKIEGETTSRPPRGPEGS